MKICMYIEKYACKKHYTTFKSLTNQNWRIFYLIRLISTYMSTKVYYKTEVRTWQFFWEALKKLMHNNANATFIVIYLIF